MVFHADFCRLQDHGHTAGSYNAEYLAASQGRSGRAAGAYEKCGHPEQDPEAGGCGSDQDPLKAMRLENR